MPIAILLGVWGPLRPDYGYEIEFGIRMARKAETGYPGFEKRDEVRLTEPGGRRFMGIRIGAFLFAALTSIAVAAIETEWMDYLGGTDYDYGSGVAIDSGGRIYVVGETRNTHNFIAAINANHGGRDAFVSCVERDGRIVWSAYVGGAGNDSGTKMVVDSSGVLYLCGFTASLDLQSATNGYRGGNSDAFVAA